MGGSITDMALRICKRCRGTWLEDDQMYVDVQRCPLCGAAADEPDEKPAGPDEPGPAGV